MALNVKQPMELKSSQEQCRQNTYIFFGCEKEQLFFWY